MMKRAMAVVIGAFAVAALTGCPGGGGTDGGEGGGTAGAGGNTGGGATAGGSGGASGGGTAGPVLPKANRSTPINITTDDLLVLAANPDDNTVSIINTMSNTKVASLTFPAGSMPVSVAIHPNNIDGYVVLRKTQKLVKVTGLNTLTPSVTAMEATVGSEPTGVALSPTGATAIVTNFGEDTVSVVNTAAMTATKKTVGPNPRAVAITNDGDGDDSDEKAYVTLFYGAPVAEASDTGRVGKVVPIPLGTQTPGAAISLNPITDTGFGVPLSDAGETPHVTCSPNQLFGIAIDMGATGGARAYVTHVCAAPQGPVNPVTNVFAGLSVINVSTDAEDTGATGSTTLARLVRAQEGTAGTGNLLGVPIAIDFKAPGIAYVASQAGDMVQRVQITATGIFLGNSTPSFAQIDLQPTAFAGIKGPIGLVAANTSMATKLYTDNWLDKSTGVVELSGTQQLTAKVQNEPLPGAGTPEKAVQDGKKFYFTGRGRWSLRGVNSCGSCHPDGLSDNITWVFAAGPRQTTPMDATFSKAAGNEQRALNWTAVFDELHDFENNTRGTAGGVGAVVNNAALANSSRIDLTVADSPDGGVAGVSGTFTRHDNLSGTVRQLMIFKSVLQDWDAIDAFSKTIHANRAPSTLNTTDVTAGRAQFIAGRCNNCHGGPKWTVSRVSFTPQTDKNGTVAGMTAGGVPVTASGLRTQALDGGTLNFSFATNRDTNKVSTERLVDGGVVGPERITCVLRDVRTYSSADAIEKKADGSQAQGENGFNVPSLLGLATSAPYMHAGAAATLDDVLNGARFQAHLTVGDQNFTPTTAQKNELKAFLLSIDENTAVIAPGATGTDICGGY